MTNVVSKKKGGNKEKKAAQKLAHSTWARQNMTEQVKGRLKFLTGNLESKKKQLAYAESFVGRLPNAPKMVKVHKRGIAKVQGDIKKLKARILKLQSEGKINKVI